MDHHVSHSDVHLGCMANVCTVEIAQLALEDLLHLVYSWVVSDLDHPVMDLSHVHLQNYFICLNATLAPHLRLTEVVELFAMRRGVKDVEDVTKHGGAW